MKRPLIGLVALALVLGLPGRAGRAGQLGAFEAALEAAASPGGAEAAGACLDGFFDSIVLDLFFIGGENSYARGTGDVPSDLDPRAGGERQIPVLSIGAAAHKVRGDVSALETAIEAGFAPLGAAARWIRYDEDTPPDTLDAIQWHLLYRMTFGNHVEIGVGMGALRIEGDATHTGFSIVTPIRVCPTDALTFEYRPVWSSIHDRSVTEHDLAIGLGWRFLQARLGYRWFSAPGETLRGPHCGLVLTW